MISVVQAQHIPKFDLQGHRGSRGLKSENSIPAFITALEYGVTTIELDVVITADKQVVVSHDPFVLPSICFDTSGNAFQGDKKFNIYKLTYAELRQFDCGSKGNDKFPEQSKEKISKPLLQDVIVAVENNIKNYTRYEVDYNIEIKSTPQGDRKSHPVPEEFSELVFSLIDQYLPWQRVVIQSFDFRVLRYWHEKHPAVRLAALIENTKSVDENLADLGFKPSIYSPYFKLLSKEKIEYIHTLSPTDIKQMGPRIRVIPWTVNEQKDMLELKSWGVDGLITDYPNRAAQAGLTLSLKK
jgi:glycerophosphoryl diester phosphodiesterase